MPGPYTFPVDLSSIMLFASAIGETNRIYYDPAYAAQTALDSVIAPPTFPIASAHWDPNHVFRGVRRIPESAPKRRTGKASLSTKGHRSRAPPNSTFGLARKRARISSLTHGFTRHSPSGVRSATRTSPRSRASSRASPERLTGAVYVFGARSTRPA